MILGQMYVSLMGISHRPMKLVLIHELKIEKIEFYFEINPFRINSLHISWATFECLRFKTIRQRDAVVWIQMNPKIDRILTRAHTQKSEYPISLCLFSVWNARISPIGMKQIKKTQLTEKYLINGYYFGRYGMVSTENTTSLRSSIKYLDFYAMHFVCMHLRLLNIHIHIFAFFFISTSDRCFHGFLGFWCMQSY